MVFADPFRIRFVILLFWIDWDCHITICKTALLITIQIAFDLILNLNPDLCPEPQPEIRFQHIFFH